MKLSIITINRNNGKGLHETIKTVVEQTYSDYEYIIIDGASSDSSVDHIKNNENKIAYWVSEADSGIYNAMNKGIRAAKGEYILFLNSGDTLCDHSILESIQVDFFSEDIVYGDIIYEGDRDPIAMPDKITLETFLGPSIGHSASFIKKELFNNYGLYSEKNRIVSDWEFFLDVFIRHKCSYRHVNKIITVYQKGGISVNPNFNQIQASERNRVLEKMFPDFYDLIQENFLLKDRLSFYEHSRIIQALKKIQHSNLNRFRNRYLRFKKL